MPHSERVYRGRFAPSPTGPLHLGSLIAALASYLDARYHRGTWLVRMEDLDPPREVAGAAQSILHSLQCHGLHWDESVLFQSTRHAAYAEKLSILAAAGTLFYCDCSRAVLGADGACRGPCAARRGQISAPCSTRIQVPTDCHIEFLDQLQGEQKIDLGKSTPNFVIKRKDGLDAYQLAVVVDDAAQDITHIVRGCDLLDSTPRQIFLQQQLDAPRPGYCHLPVITTDQGQKFSKQNHAPDLDNDKATPNLRRALNFLRQEKPPSAITSTDELLSYAISQWEPRRVPPAMAIAASQID